MSRKGRLVAVVGPSGVGKDSLIDALCAAEPGLSRVRRVITRAQDAGGEDFEPATRAEFEAQAVSGGFVLHWSAHGFRYGIPTTALAQVEAGREVIANLSRGVVAEAARLFPAIHVLSVTADPRVIARRIRDRGRESPAEIAVRLARPGPAMPDGVPLSVIDNSGPLAESLRAARMALYPDRGAR